MKIILFVTILGISICNGQNLLPNPSFEEYIHCPIGVNRMDSCLYWKNYGNSPDYFHACNVLLIPPPFGYQLPHSGDAMAGLITWHKHTEIVEANYREFIGIQLNEQLEAGKKYFISMFISFANTHLVAVASNNMGIKFSTIPYDSTALPLLNNLSILYTDTIVTDSTNWIQMFGSFIADSNYLYLVIGNFFDDTHTDTLSLSQYPDYAYYYIDDVCVSHDSLYALGWTGVSFLKPYNPISIFPNPADKFITVKSETPITLISVSNDQGLVVQHLVEANRRSYKIDVSKFSNGMYFLSINSEDKYLRKKFLITH